MKDFTIIGLGRFGQCMLESLIKRRLNVLVIDQDEDKVQWARDLATKAVKADVLHLEVFRELLPERLHCAIVDLGDRMERSILVTNYLHKLDVQHIIVEAVNAEHAEILQIVGATRIVFPEREAAERLAGLVAGRDTLDYFPVSEAFSLVEITAPKHWIGRTLLDLNLRRKSGVTVVAVRKRSEPDGDEKWRLMDPAREILADDIMLVAGAEKDIERSLA